MYDARHHMGTAAPQWDLPSSLQSVPRPQCSLLNPSLPRHSDSDSSIQLSASCSLPARLSSTSLWRSAKPLGLPYPSTRTALKLAFSSQLSPLLQIDSNKDLCRSPELNNGKDLLHEADGKHDRRSHHGPGHLAHAGKEEAAPAFWAQGGLLQQLRPQRGAEGPEEPVWI